LERFFFTRLRVRGRLKARLAGLQSRLQLYAGILKTFFHGNVRKGVRPFSTRQAVVRAFVPLDLFPYEIEIRDAYLFTGVILRTPNVHPHMFGEATFRVVDTTTHHTRRSLSRGTLNGDGRNVDRADNRTQQGAGFPAAANHMTVKRWFRIPWHFILRRADELLEVQELVAWHTIL